VSPTAEPVPIREVERLGRRTIIWLWIVLALMPFGIALVIWDTQIVSARDPQASPADTDWTGPEIVIGWGYIGFLLLLIVGFVYRLRFQYRCHMNLSALGAGQPRWKVWVGLLSWLVPGADLLVPYLALRRILLGGAPAAGFGARVDRAASRLVLVALGVWRRQFGDLDRRMGLGDHPRHQRRPHRLQPDHNRRRNRGASLRLAVDPLRAGSVGRSDRPGTGSGIRVTPADAAHCRRPGFDDHPIENGTTARRWWSTLICRSTGGTARWWQASRSQIRQLMPIGSKAASLVTSRSSA